MSVDLLAGSFPGGEAQLLNQAFHLVVVTPQECERHDVSLLYGYQRGLEEGHTADLPGEVGSQQLLGSYREWVGWVGHLETLGFRDFLKRPEVIKRSFELGIARRALGGKHGSGVGAFRRHLRGMLKHAEHDERLSRFAAFAHGVGAVHPADRNLEGEAEEWIAVEVFGKGA